MIIPRYFTPSEAYKDAQSTAYFSLRRQAVPRTKQYNAICLNFGTHGSLPRESLHMIMGETHNLQHRHMGTRPSLHQKKNKLQ